MSIQDHVRFVPVQCTGCGTEVQRRVSDIAEHEFFWCDECKPERHRELQRNYYELHKNDPAFRRRQQAADRKYRARKKQDTQGQS